MGPRTDHVWSGDAGMARARGQRGQDLVEFALILPLLLALTFGIIDFGRAVFSYDTIVNAAREGARYGSLNPTDTAGIVARAQALTGGLRCDTLNIQSAPNPIVNPVTIRVQVDCRLHLITGVIPQALGGTAVIPLHAEATMQVE